MTAAVRPAGAGGPGPAGPPDASVSRSRRRAGPPGRHRKDVWVESEGLDIILAIDASGSMRAEDFTPGLTPVNRLQVAKGVMEEFIKSAQRPDRRWWCSAKRRSPRSR